MNEHLLSTLQQSKTYTLAVVGTMPEKQYGFKPVETVMDFGELMNHIAYGIYWWTENYVEGKKTDWAPPAVKKNRSAVVANLDQAYAFLLEAISGKKLSQKAVEGFHATLDHITHHRGQAVLFLRCQGLVPPEYVY